VFANNSTITVGYLGTLTIHAYAKSGMTCSAVRSGTYKYDCGR